MTTDKRPGSKTWREIMNELLACKSKKQAQEWFEKEVHRHVETYGKNPITAEHDLRSSLGYMMGYYDDKTARRAQKLLDLCHPLFPWVGKEDPTEDCLRMAFEKGKELGRSLEKTPNP